METQAAFLALCEGNPSVTGRFAGLLTTFSKVNCWADVGNHVVWLWQAGDTDNFERQITGSL